MRTAVLAAVLATTLVLLGGPVAAGNPGGGAVTDDPSGQQAGGGFDGSGTASAEAFLGGQEPASRAERSSAIEGFARRVMPVLSLPGYVPVLLRWVPCCFKDVDARGKPGYDELNQVSQETP